MVQQTATPATGSAHDEPVLVTRSAGVVQVTLNRPDVLNALTLQVLRELKTALQVAEADPAVRVVVLSGAGRGFSSGWDRGPAGAAVDPAEVLANDALGREVVQLLTSMVTLTVARIHGPVVGGGVLLAAGCDFRIASQETYFWLPEISFGNPLLWTGLAPLTREIGFARTRYLAVSNQRVDAAWALSAGLVHEVMPSDRLDERLDTFVEDLLAIPTRGVALMKQDLARVAADLPDHHGHSALTVHESLTAGSFQPH